MENTAPVFEGSSTNVFLPADPDGSLALTQAQQEELLRRLEDDDENPDDVVPWDQVKAEALARWKR